MFAGPVYLQFMSHWDKIVRLRKPILQLFDLLVIDLDETPAFYADEVVMMLLSEFGFISGLLFADLYLICQTALAQEAQISVDCCVTYLGIF